MSSATYKQEMSHLNEAREKNEHKYRMLFFIIKTVAFRLQAGFHFLLCSLRGVDMTFC